VFAAVAIGAGTHIGTYEGVETESDGTHVLWVESDDGWLLIDGTGILRWLNHSPTPNAAFDGPELFAIEDIDPGIEITFDYGEEWAEDEPPEPFEESGGAKVRQRGEDRAGQSTQSQSTR
jgi:hypothetical protein